VTKSDVYGIIIVQHGDNCMSRRECKQKVEIFKGWRTNMKHSRRPSAVPWVKESVSVSGKTELMKMGVK
jgi:hypothetical protein